MTGAPTRDVKTTHSPIVWNWFTPRIRCGSVRVPQELSSRTMPPLSRTWVATRVTRSFMCSCRARVSNSSRKQRRSVHIWDSVPRYTRADRKAWWQSQAEAQGKPERKTSEVNTTWETPRVPEKQVLSPPPCQLVGLLIRLFSCIYSLRYLGFHLTAYFVSTMAMKAVSRMRSSVGGMERLMRNVRGVNADREMYAIISHPSA